MFEEWGRERVARCSLLHKPHCATLREGEEKATTPDSLQSHLGHLAITLLCQEMEEVHHYQTFICIAMLYHYHLRETCPNHCHLSSPGDSSPLPCWLNVITRFIHWNLRLCHLCHQASSPLPCWHQPSSESFIVLFTLPSFTTSHSSPLTIEHELSPRNAMLSYLCHCHLAWYITCLFTWQLHSRHHYLSYHPCHHHLTPASCHDQHWELASSSAPDHWTACKDN